MATGKITQIIGAVIDVEFPREAIPHVYEALKLKEKGVDLTLEVQQLLGDGIVRTIAMGPSEGLKPPVVPSWCPSVRRRLGGSWTCSACRRTTADR
jgi:F0F1-type ATP synthase beta subunit